MTGPLWTFILRLETALREKPIPRAVFYGCIAAALLAVWLWGDGTATDFVYSEF